MPSYGRLGALFYDIDKPDPPPDAFDFYLERARKAGGPVLEGMCGSGRFLVPLLAEGVDVDGVDVSPAMLDVCRKRCQRLGFTPELHLERLETLSLTRTYALAFVASGSFCLLTERASVELALRSLYAALRPGGTLLIEFERLRDTSIELSGNWGGRWVSGPDGSKIVISWLSQYSGRPDVVSSLHRYEHVVDGKVSDVEYEDFNVKCYALEEARDVLLGAGFSDVQALRPYSAEPAHESDEAWVFTCVKPRSDAPPAAS